MPNKNMRKAPAGIPTGLATRANIAVNPSTFREADSSVEFILATEEPAMVWDWNRFEVVREILVADGVILPKNGQIPLVNSHDRSTVDNIFGSVREIKPQAVDVVGRLYFASDESSQRAMTKVQEGHIDSGSAGYEQVDSVWIPDGQSMVHNGRTFAGPVLLTKQWALKEFSLVAIGADPNAKAREEVVTISREAVDQIDKEKISMDPIITPEQPTTVDVEAIKREALQTEQVRASKIMELCSRHNCVEMAADLVRTGANVEVAQDKILDAIAARTVALSTARPSDISIGKEAGEKFRDAASDAIIMRSGMKVSKPADGAEQMRGLSFTDIARESLNLKGENTSRMSKEAILQRALAVSDFPSILANVSNKAVMIGYQAAPQTWRAWAKMGTLPDFKAAQRVQLDDAPDMIATPDGHEIQQGVIGDKGESISLVNYARKLVITRQALINDDMGVFNTIFRAFGYRAANLIEATAYGILINNALMADGYALFSTDHTNLAGAAAPVSSTSVNLREIDMMNQTAPNGTKLSIMPQFLIVGPKNKIAASVLCNSSSSPDATYNAGVVNPFGDLTPIVSAHMGQKWVLSANPNQIDTVEVAFLNGKDTPTLYQNENVGDILGRTFVGYIDIGAAALEFRGLQYNAGT